MASSKIRGYTFNMYNFELAFLLVQRYNKRSKHKTIPESLQFVKKLMDNFDHENDTYAISGGYIITNQGISDGIVDFHIGFDTNCAADDFGIERNHRSEEDRYIIYNDAPIDA